MYSWMPSRQTLSSSTFRKALRGGANAAHQSGAQSVAAAIKLTERFCDQR
jgi:hypothetical protein